MLTRSDGSPIYVLWALGFADDRDEPAAISCTWDELAEQQLSHGVQLLFTKKRVAWLTLFPEERGNGRRYNYSPPSPRPFFSFARLGQPLQGDPEWRYSAFGYELDDGSLFVVKVYPWNDLETLILPPDEPFPL